jgi:hypothetical protein
MKVLGFRSDQSAPRYALVENLGGKLRLLNADTESRLSFPADCNEDAAKLAWLYREFARIFHEHENITRVVVKKGEFTQGDSLVKRVASYQEAALLLYCGLKAKPIVAKLYVSLSTKSTLVKDHAAERIGRTTSSWNVKMADAVVAAWWGATNP